MSDSKQCTFLPEAGADFSPISSSDNRSQTAGEEHMTTEIAKIWFDSEKVVVNPIPAHEIFKPVPVAWFFQGSADEPMSVALDKDLDDAQKANCIPLYFGNPV